MKTHITNKNEVLKQRIWGSTLFSLFIIVFEVCLFSFLYGLGLHVHRIVYKWIWMRVAFERCDVMHKQRFFVGLLLKCVFIDPRKKWSLEFSAVFLLLYCMFRLNYRCVVASHSHDVHKESERRKKWRNFFLWFSRISCSIQCSMKSEWMAWFCDILCFISGEHMCSAVYP